MRRILNSDPFYTRLANIVIAIIGIGFLIIAGKMILCPLIFSLLFSILLLPVSDKLEKKLHFHRALSSAISVLILLCLLGLVLFILSAQVGNLMGNIAMFKNELSVALAQLKKWSLTKFNLDLSDHINQLTTGVFNSENKVFSTTILSISSIMLFMVFLIFDTFFLLFYRRLFVGFLLSLFRDKGKLPAVYEMMEQVKSTMRSYLIGLLFEMATVTTICSLAFWAIGIKYALLLGFITGLFNIIPYVGIFTALLINILITCATAGAAKMILVIVTVVIVHLLDSNILLPFIVGRKVRINALITILGLAIGELVWQIPGMFLSIPVMAIIKIVCDHVDNLKPLGLLLGDDNSSRKPT